MATLLLVAWCDHDVYCWHRFVGQSGKNNDINVIMRSSLLRYIIDGTFQFLFEADYKLVLNGKLRTLL